MPKLSDYLTVELDARGWSMRELSRRSGISHPQISGVIGGRANAGADFCIAIARALGEPPEHILRLAGILPPLPPPVEDEREALGLFRQLERDARRVILATMRTLTGYGRTAVRPSSINEPTTSYGRTAVRPSSQPATLPEHLAQDIARQLETLTPEDQRRVIDLMRRLSGDPDVGPVSNTPPPAANDT